MDFEKAKNLLENEPVFRLMQVKKAIFQDLVDDWDEVTSLPKELREKLSKNCPIQELVLEKILISKDNQTIKALFRLNDSYKIESVLMKHADNRRTVCLSSQVGCAMNCRFCATGQLGFKRNLTASEIIDQVLFFVRLIKKDNERVSGVVFMGMGEPFLNYDNVMEAIKILNDKDGLNIGARHISISTCGIIEGIKKLAKENLEVNLAISFHALKTEEARERVLSAIDDYIKKTKRRVMFEYLMMKNVNDSPTQAKELVRFLKGLKNRLFFVNLISFNPIGDSEFKPCSGERIKKFKEILEESGIAVTQRYRFGKEIKAACGQLAS